MLDTMLSLAFVAAVLITESYCLTVSDRADCTEVLANAVGYTPSSGRYHLLVGEARRSRWAFCDMITDGGGWTVIQKRISNALTFNQTWVAYEDGFGDVNSNHWLGNKYIHSMTYGKRYILRVQYGDWAGNMHYAEYDDFRVGGAGCNYTLESLGKFCGDCGDALTYHLNSKFSTYDRDNDLSPGTSCSVLYRGAWWYNNCYHSSLNGEYKQGIFNNGITWSTCNGYYSYMTTTMMIRPYKF